MASSKVMASLSSRSSDLSRKSSSGSSKPKPQPTPLNSVADRPITVEEFLRRPSSAAGESTLLDGVRSSSTNSSKTVDEVWREIVSGESHNRRKQCKEEPLDAVMTLEDFLLAKTGAEDEDDDEEEDEVDVKNFALATSLSERLSGRIFGFDPASPSSFGFDAASPSSFRFENVESSVVRKRGRGRGVLEPLDKAAQQRQRRMIKNRESAARSRERKQAYQVELESLAVRLEEEHDQLLREKAERTRERFKQLMENIIPIEEKRRPPRVLRRVRSIEW